MKSTSVYTRLHSAFVKIAKNHGLQPSDVRMLVALSERSGSATTPELYADLDDSHGSMVRRSSLVLRKCGLVEADRADGEPGPPVRGVNIEFKLTDDGWDVVGDWQELAGLFEPEGAV